MKKTPIALLSVPLVVSILLTACAGERKPTASPPTADTSKPASTASVSPTTVSSVQPPPDVHTKTGAEAFSRRFFKQVNRAWMLPDPHGLDGLYSSTCTTCDAIRGSAAGYKVKGQRYRDTPLTRISAKSLTKATGTTTQVRVTAMQEASAIVDRTSKVIEAVPRTPSMFVLTLTWSNGWRVSLMQVKT